MYRDQCSKTLYRTPLQPGWWLEGNQAMKSLKLLMFAALMVAMARALSLIPGIPIAHTKMTWGWSMPCAFTGRGSRCCASCWPTWW